MEKGEENVGINRKNIDTAADIVRNSLSLQVPIAVSELCSVINGKLPGNCQADTELTVDAEIKPDDQGQRFEVRYQSNKPETRILFSIAHELGHLFLHLLNQDGTLKTGEVCQRNMDWNEKELEANEFAAAFLMPEEEFIEKCLKYMDGNKVNVTKVAQDFNVSVQAAIVRGDVLELW